jgi:predicted signal transduction protein with EAL and GGDEF domain
MQPAGHTQFYTTLTDATAARLGGDEFAVILTRIEQPDQALDVAQRIVDSICEPMQLDRLHLQVGVSVGIAFGPGDAESSEQLLRCADLALYHAKEQGRGCASVYDRDMHEAMQDRRQLTSDLRLAVSRGELELFYQPLVEVQTGITQGYEALLRWHHPVRGMVSPADFIPIAEETGLIVPIGEWVIRAGLDELATWPEHLSLAVNLSPVQVRSDNLIPVVVQALGASSVDPTRFELEITESVLLHDSEENATVLHKLRDLGIRIALDDFGTGYSSLNCPPSAPMAQI